MMNSTENSSILLVCIGQELGWPSTREAGVGELRELFAAFGALRKIIVFSRKFVLKAFVEFARPEDAKRARVTANERLLPGLGRARVYFSALQQLASGNRYLESWDSSTVEEEYELTPGKDERLTCASSADSSGTEACDLSFTRANDGLERGGPSPVVLVSNVDAVFDSARELLNLFGCFGYVVKLLFMRNLRKALVEYASPAHAECAVNAINAAGFEGLRIKASFSRYRYVDLRKNNKSGNSQLFNEVIVLSPSQNRLQPAELPRRALSRAVLLRCDRSAGIQHVDLYLLAQDMVVPAHVRLVSDDSGALQLRLDFANEEEAALAVTKLHGSFLGDSSVAASFI